MQPHFDESFRVGKVDESPAIENEEAQTSSLEASDLVGPSSMTIRILDRLASE